MRGRPPFLLAAGLMVCCLLGAACGALALANGTAARAAGKGLKGAVVLGIMALRCDGLMAVLGVTHHTGQVGAGCWVQGEPGWDHSAGEGPSTAGCAAHWRAIELLPAFLPACLQGFWARLTVHDTQPADDLERGWHGKLSGLKNLGAVLMAHIGVDQLPPAVLAVGQHTLLCTLPILGLAALTTRLQRGSGAGSGLQR